jgi:hypothetical protein
MLSTYCCHEKNDGKDKDFSTALDWNSLVGSALNLLDWGGSVPRSEFARVVFPEAFDLDLSRLYTSGEVIVIAVPEPSSVTLFGLGLLAGLGWQRQRYRRQPCVQ